ncbi:uncharacterized protein LOC119165386 isoform X2 [Rhipicephalus microplus]|uniref:uncharacterized protein LOC119165386 isoform X2 n=1 Tax=Rhipicephalus microplus TaxID=6941 RepID=UPI003F6AFA80
MNICTALHLLFIVVICDSSGKGYDDSSFLDHRCLIPYRAPKRPFFHCRTRGWYFDNSTRQCVPSCKPAPFLTQLECIGVCRSVESCGFPVEGSLCLFEVFSVYAYDPITRNCFMTYDCSMFGNKFRSYKECRSTCVGGQYEALTQKVDYDALLASGQQRFIGPPGSSQSQIQRNGTMVGIPQLPFGPGQTSGSTQVPGSNESGSGSQQQQTLSSQTTSSTGSGTTIGAVGNAVQQQGGQTSTASQVASAIGSGMSQANTSQTSLGGGAVLQKPDAQGGATGTIQVPSSQGKLNTSTEQQNSSQSTQGTGDGAAHGTNESGLQQQNGETSAVTQTSSTTGNGGITTTTSQTSVGGGAAVTQINGQQESQQQTEVNRQGSNKTESVGSLAGERKPRKELLLPTLKVFKRKPTAKDRDCKVAVPLETTGGCRRRKWYYDKKTGTCRPSCSKSAPFSHKIACDGVCRSLEACDFPMASIPCFFRSVHVVYVYNQYKKKCMRRYDCSYFGNKFPTLGECQRTCKKYEALREVKKINESSSQVSTKREKIISTMTEQQKTQQSVASSVQGSLGSGTSQAQVSTSSSSGSVQSSQTAGQSVTQEQAESSSSVHVNGTSPNGLQSVSSSISQASGQTSQSNTNAGSSTLAVSSGAGQAGGAGQQQSTPGSVNISESSSNTQNSHSSASHGQSSSIPVGSTGSGILSNEVVTGTSPNGVQSTSSSISQASGQTSQSNTNAGSSTPAVSSGATQAGGAGQQQSTTSSVNIPESSSHTQNSHSTASHGQSSSISVGSTGSGILSNEVVTGGRQSQTISGGGSSLSPNHIRGPGTLIGNETVPSGTDVSAGTSTQGQQQQRGSEQQNLQSGTASSSQINTQVAGSNMNAVQQSSSTHWNHVTGADISTRPGHRRFGVCEAAVHTAYCLFEAYAMYAYDSYSGTCFMIYDCSLYGNKFPTLEACKRTCIPGGRQPQLHAPDIQKILNLTRPSTEMVQSSVKGTQISQRPSGPAQVPSLPGGTHISGSQGKLNASMQQTTSAQSTVISSTGTSVGQTETGSTSQQASGQGQISGGQVATQQSSGGGGATVTQSAQEKQESDKDVAMDEKWFNELGESSTLEQQQKILKKMNLRSVKVTKPKLSPYDKKCRFTVPKTVTKGCARPRWYYNGKTRRCHQICSKKAPFSNKIACDGVCRSLEACDFPMASLFCFFRPAHEVYVYNQYSKRCFKSYDCSTFGNKFPTLKECETTCQLYELQQRVNASAKNTTEATINRNTSTSITIGQQSASQSSSLTETGSSSSQSATELPKPALGTPGGNGDIPAQVPTTNVNQNTASVSSGTPAQGSGASSVKTGRK